ncbi:MAG: DUF2312 domain-containing protein [Novosphingobium sp.]|uniref:DUF2312 domain-containing protein n=1 Tax=Novosphingobium sp. TaxID=1874826 RepID=UPI0027327281|nr:DUF2312 domain-containing protein [Novosphingobium sp.]MDP3550624.1 DUF2312 domain-containing protein [Novosphingobium sp.]
MNDDRRLKGLVERVEMIDAEVANLQGERREVMAEVKAVGYNLATFRQVIARRKMTPSERGEADALLEAYEAALGGEAPAVPLRIDAMALATNLLAAELDGLADVDRAQLLVEHVVALLDLRDEVAQLREAEKARRKLAADQGFQVKQLALTVRWYEQCAKHGVALMRGGEEVFRAYRGTVDEAGGPARIADAPTADEKLAALFAKPPKPATTKQKQVGDAIAFAQIARMNRGIR